MVSDVPPAANPQKLQQKEEDVFRDSPVRYLGTRLLLQRHRLRSYLLSLAGYANELGESFRPIMPGLVVPSYIVAFGYVLADTHDKYGRATARKVGAHIVDDLAILKAISVQADSTQVAAATADTLIWQTLVSILTDIGFIYRI